MQVGQGGLGLVCGCFAFLLSAKIGRRTHVLMGLVMDTTLMFLVAIVSCPPQTTALGYLESVFALLWWGVFELTVSPATWTIVGEAAAVSVRQKTIGLGRILYNILEIVNAVISPPMLNPTARNWKGKSAFLPAILSVLCTIWAYFRIPETKGRTYEELDVMFDRGVPTREFKNYEINLYADVE